MKSRKSKPPRLLIPEPPLIQPQADLIETELDRPPSALSPPPSAPPAAGSGGLECRSCGCRHFEVVYTERRSGGSSGGFILRRRECRHCGKRITTREQIVGPG